VGDRQPLVLGPGAGTSAWTLGGRFTVKLGEALSQGRVSVIEVTAYRTADPPLHIHHREDEAWYILEGQMTFHVGGAAHTVTAGSFVFAPMGIAHTFTVDVEPTRVLLLASPSGFENFALQLGVPADGDPPSEGLAVPGPEVLGPVAERYGIEVVGPPWRIAHPEDA